MHHLCPWSPVAAATHSMWRRALFDALYQVIPLDQVRLHLDPAFQAFSLTPDASSAVYELQALAHERQTALRAALTANPGFPRGAQFLHHMEELQMDPLFTHLDQMCRGNPFLRESHQAEQVQQAETAPASELQPYATVMYNASLDQRLLVQAGPRRSPSNPSLLINSPPCKEGNRCIGVTGQLKGLPVSQTVVFMARLLPDELEAHERTGEIPQRFEIPLHQRAEYVATRIPPPTYRPTACVLCSWYEWSKLVWNLQCRQEIDATRTVPLRPWFGNLVDVPNGYRASVCRNLVDWGVVVPVPLFHHDLIRVYAEEKDGPWRVNIDAMLYPIPSPRTDRPFGTRGFVASIPASVLNKKGQEVGPRHSVAYLVQLNGVRSSLGARPLLRLNEALPPPPLTAPSSSCIHTQDLCTAPRSLLLSHMHRFNLRALLPTKPLKPTSLATRRHCPTAAIEPIEHVREPLLELVHKCWPTWQSSKAAPMRHRIQRLMTPSLKKLEFRIQRTTGFNLMSLCVTEWMLAFWSGAFARPHRTAHPPVDALLEKQWRSRHTVATQATLVHTFLHGQDERICVAILCVFGVYCIQSTGGATEWLDTRTQGQWSRYAHAVWDLHEAYLFSTSDRPIKQAYLAMTTQSDAVARALFQPQPLAWALGTALVDTKATGLRSPVPRHAVEFRIENTPLTSLAHPVDTLVRSILDAPLTPSESIHSWLVRLVPRPYAVIAWHWCVKLMAIWHCLAGTRHPISIHWDLLLISSVAAFFSHPFPAWAWQTVIAQLFAPHLDLANYLGQMLLERENNGRCVMPIEFKVAQVKAALGRFTRTVTGPDDSSAWPSSELATQYLLPPADLLVLCPRCHVSRSMINQFVSVASTTLQCCKATKVTGFNDVLVSEPDCFCHRPDGKKAAFCLNTKLVSMGILGQVVTYQHRKYYLCAEPGCGIIAEWSPTAWPLLYPGNEQGLWVCAYCYSQRLLKTELAFADSCLATAQ